MTMATNKEKILNGDLIWKKAVSRGQCIGTAIETATLCVTQDQSLWLRYLMSNPSPRYYVGWR